MKQFVYLNFLGAILCLYGCGGGLIKNKNGDTGETLSSGAKSKVPVPVATRNLVIADEKDLPGYWVGEFGADTTGGDTLGEDDGDPQFNKINISIDTLNGNDVKGHTVIAGKVRLFSCTLVTAGSKYQFTFNGWADEKSAGIFKFSIAKGDSAIKGRWDAGDKIPAHYFVLTKHFFNYNPGWNLTMGQYVDWGKRKTVTIKADSGQTYQNEAYFSTTDEVEKHNASAEELTKQYVANLKKADLIVLRNSIFARHGYTFKKPMLSLYFSQQPWYIPLSSDVTTSLTAIEKKNIALMAPYEKHAEEYYGAFGR